jgi:hypothetical protein
MTDTPEQEREKTQERVDKFGLTLKSGARRTDSKRLLTNRSQSITQKRALKR